jgi:hypothetical protein
MEEGLIILRKQHETVREQERKNNVVVKEQLEKRTI